MNKMTTTPLEVSGIGPGRSNDDDFDEIKHCRGRKKSWDVEKIVKQIINKNNEELQAMLKRTNEAEQGARAFE